MRSTILSSLRACVCGFFMLLVATTASAQFKASVQGTVTDVGGGLVQGATVTLTSKETGKTQQTTTNEQGFYRITGLAPGDYSLTVEQTGFNKKVLESIPVTAEATQGVDVVLEAGAVTASVTVTDQLPSALETENANVDRALTTVEVRQLPQVGRDPYELVRLAPGVLGSGARGGNGNAVGLPNTTGPGGSNSSIFQVENQVPISANGQRLSNNNYQIDGVSVNSLGFGGAAVVTPNQESVKEVQVLSSSYSAEDGRNSGAQVKVVSQNGTNDLHGSAFLKYDSPKLNAFNTYGGFNGARPIRVENFFRQFGGSIGGPVYLPRFGEGPPPAFLSGKNHLFFFFSYEGLRQSSTNTATAFVETPEFRQLVQTLRPNGITAGIFGATGIAPRIVSVLPVTCANFGNDPNRCRVVPGGLDIGSPTGALGLYTGIMGGGFDNIPDIQFVQFALPNHSRGNQYNLRFDYNRGNKDTFALSTYQTFLDAVGSDAAAAGRPMADIAFKPKTRTYTLLYNRVLSPTMLNELRFNATRFADNQVKDAASTNFGIPRIEIEALPFDRIRFGADRSEATPAIFAQNTYELSDTLSKVFGTHAAKFGAVIRKEQDNNSLVGGARPLYTFTGLFNFANDTPVFELINVDPNTGAPANAQRYFRTNYYGFFGQDDWKVRPNLTINLGLRYEYFSPLSEKRGQLSNLVFGSNGLQNARIVVTDRLFQPDKNNFAPRFGFAYSPNWKGFGNLFAENRAVIRGGAGIFYNRIPDVLFSNTRGNPPFFARQSLCCGFPGSPFAGGQILYSVGANGSIFSYPANPVLATGIDPVTGAPRSGSVEIYGAQPNTPNSYVYVYSLEIQYSLPWNLVATAGYQGSAGHKLIRLVNQNFLFPNNPAFFAVYFPQPDVNSNYNGMNLELSRRFSKGWLLQANYRFSKSIDELSYEGPGGVTNQTYPQDNRTERGPSDFDVRHYFVLSNVYELPFYREQRDALGKLLGGFSISTIITARSGFPFTPKTGRCVSTPGGPTLCPARPTGYLGGAGTDTSNLAFITGSNFAGGGLRYFTVNTLPGGTVGPPGIGRNSFRGPHYFDVDMSLVKQLRLPDFMRLSEESNFEFRVNFFNIFNMLNLANIGFSDPGAIIEDPNFGRSSSGLAGRVVELQGRYRF